MQKFAVTGPLLLYILVASSTTAFSLNAVVSTRPTSSHLNELQQVLQKVAVTGMGRGQGPMNIRNARFILKSKSACVTVLSSCVHH